MVILLHHSILYILLWASLLFFLLLATKFDLTTRSVPNLVVYGGSLVGLLLRGYYQGLFSTSLFFLQVIVVIVLSLIALRYFPLGGADWKGFIMVTCYSGFMGFVFVFVFSLFVQMMIYMVRFFRGNMNLELVYFPAITIGAIIFLLFQLVAI